MELSIIWPAAAFGKRRNDFFVCSAYATGYLTASGLTMDTKELRKIGQRADRVGADRQLRDAARRSSNRPPVQSVLISAVLLAIVLLAAWWLD
jgi:hypothetical protein